MDKKHINRMYSSLANTLNKELAKKGIKNKIKIGGELKDPKEERPLYMIVQERIGKTNNSEVSDVESRFLTNDINIGMTFSRENIDRGDYKDVLIYSRRMIEDCNLMDRHPDVKPGSFEDIKKRAQGVIGAAGVAWEYPQNADLVLEMEISAEKGDYKKADELKKQLLTIQRDIMRNL